MGNALRRVLLSSIPGAAVSWVKIEGVEHEFSTLSYMKEDIVEFLLNVKALRLRPLLDRPGKLKLEVEGEGEVSAADITPSAEFEIVNPEIHLATLDSPEARLFVEFNVELGKGYVPAHSDGPIGIIPIDAIFTPMRKVNYTITPVHVSQDSSYERLTLEVWTDGTISPEEAVSQSATILMEQLSPFRPLAKKIQEEPEEQRLPFDLSPEQHNMLLKELGLSTRTLNSLRRYEIITVGDLLAKNERELLSLRNFGQKSRDEVRDCLEALGLSRAGSGEE
jgi:DNA-directed RNA polymerase subunit alpha